jgi:tungstate transport system ATP-binding protein
LNPRVLLLDEPTANLDPANIKAIEQIVHQANQTQQTTMIMVTHNTFQARRMADRVCLLLNGLLVEVAPTEDFFERPSSPETAAFLSGDIIY